MLYFKYFASRTESDGSKMREKRILFFSFHWAAGKHFAAYPSQRPNTHPPKAVPFPSDAQNSQAHWL